MRVVICGGGVIGACTAYFLSLRQAEVVVVERTGVACAASGKSGGFLALDWCDGSPLAALGRRSFELHAELAGEFDGRWGYRRLEAPFSLRESVEPAPREIRDYYGETVCRRGQPVRAGGNPDRFGREVQPVGIGGVHPAIDVEKGDP